MENKPKVVVPDRLVLRRRPRPEPCAAPRPRRARRELVVRRLACDRG